MAPIKSLISPISIICCSVTLNMSDTTEWSIPGKVVVCGFANCAISLDLLSISTATYRSIVMLQFWREIAAHPIPSHMDSTATAVTRIFRIEHFKEGANIDGNHCLGAGGPG